MIAVDTNILVYAHRNDTPWFEKARRCVQQLCEGHVQWAVPWPCVHEFLAVVTHPRVFAPPTPPAEAFDQVCAWLESPTVVLLAEGPGYADILRAIVLRGGIVGPRIHDARVAALCLHHGVWELWSADRDFSRVADLRVRNPLVAASSAAATE